MKLVYKGTDKEWSGERINGISHPRNIKQLWSDAELDQIGLERKAQPGPSLELIKSQFLQRIDGDAEAVRLKYITPGAGMMMTYREKLEQAEQAIGQGQTAIDALTEQEEQAAYPTLAASVGIEAKTLWDCAQLVMQNYQKWATLSHNIEKIRLAGKKAIEDAASVDDVQTAYQSINWGAI